MSKDGEAISELGSISDVNAQHPILHYLYTPNGESAALVATDLRTRGFNTEERHGADGKNWLVLARHIAVPSESLLAETRRMMEALVTQVGGEYDGWEAEVQQHY